MALTAPAYGGTARFIRDHLRSQHEVCGLDIAMHLTKMADPLDSRIETNEDVAWVADLVVQNPRSKIVFFSTAMCDFEGSILEEGGISGSGKDRPRLKTAEGEHLMRLTPADKVISKFRKTRKDLFLVGFKTTAGATPYEQFQAGLLLLKKNSCNLVLANDIHTRLNMVITPEQARYYETTERATALRGLVDMAMLRHRGTFTRSTVVDSPAVDWNGSMIPDSLRTVVNHCVERGAYRPFNGSTVGHFAFKVSDTKFITSKRKVDFNRLSEVGMILCEAEGEDRVIAHGHKPSVGGQSQRIIFREHPDVDCIVHAHVPLRQDSKIPVKSQLPYECGSHECGRNTSEGLGNFDGIKAVMLDRHGPNIVFHRDTDPQKVIDFIEANFDLTKQTSELVGSV